MAETYLVDCANCGQQVMIMRADDICYWCNKSATKKEVDMSFNQGETEPAVVPVERALVPPRPSKRSRHQEYYEKNKEAMVADYKAMKIVDFYKRWHISTGGWAKLKALWMLESKPRGGARPPAKRPQTANNPPAGEKTTTELLAEANIQIAYLRGFQAAALAFFGKNH